MTILQKIFRKDRNADPPPPPPVLESFGICPICEQAVTFVAREEWLRDHFLCPVCLSVPRERAVMVILKELFPNWSELTIHESSPGGRGASVRLARECTNYISSHYWPDQEPGSVVDGVRCENLEALTFEDESIDIHISQDVMEHVYRPSRVFREIQRTLRPGGAHIFSVPLVRKSQPSRVRAIVDDSGTINHLLPPQYHGNPISAEGSLVTMDWGYDICEHIYRSSGLWTRMTKIDDLSRGIRAEYIEILASFKPPTRDGDDQIP